MRRAIVTGADGFLGRHLVPALEQHGVTVTGLVRRTAPGMAAIPMGKGAWSTKRLADLIGKLEPDVVFHLAGRVVGSERELQDANTGLAISVMDALRDARSDCALVCCGSAAEYGDAIIDGVPVSESDMCAPRGPYGASKLAQTVAAMRFADATGTRVIVARIFNPIGPGMPPHLALGDFARQVASLPWGGTLETGNIDVYRDFLDVRHVAASLCKLARNPQASGIVNICSGDAIQLRGLVENLVTLSSKTISIMPVARRMRPGEASVIKGSTARLARFGAMPPRTNYPAVMARVWQDAQARWSFPQ